MDKYSFRFGTVGTPKNKPAKPGGSVGGIYYLAELGLNAMELGWVRSVRVSESTAENIHAAGKEQDVALSVHAPYYINLNADDEEWPKSRKRLMDAARAGYASGATDIIFHPGSYFGKSPVEVLNKSLPRLEGCVKELQAEGNSVTLRPETMGKGAML
ncbi:MAG: TIM barrel protein, partial [Chloroflexi bacterium]|nr:TIM barrel protein [Chloroflexota bacterium]